MTFFEGKKNNKYKFYLGLPTFKLNLKAQFPRIVKYEENLFSTESKNK